jgi:hypothetical protein
VNFNFTTANLIFGGSLVVLGLVQVMGYFGSLWLAVLVLGILFIVER